ncbi:MAG: tRNA lysidine(34) synthetase TilS [Alphaproteobacteria bacterium]|nr:tRNA lysidine(34) synthetase TilS [Alphaproteobacteria bacterium]
MSAGPAPFEPVGAAEFATLMDELGLPPAQPARLAIACSGGADSLALALLARDWCRGKGISPLALIVDHRLRPESADEARRTEARLVALGIEARTLVRSGPVPRSNLQEAARETRYRLLAAACRAAGIAYLLLAHHRDDQAETFLLRLGRGSGVDGLAAMAPVTKRPADEVTLLRPLLGLPRARLRATLEAHGLTWEEDPGNRNEAFARVRLRRLMPMLAAEGMGARRLAATAARMRRAKSALDHYSVRLLGETATMDQAGFALLDAAGLADAPEEVGLRALSRLLMGVSGAARPARLERLEALHAAIVGARLGRGRTFMGCRILPWRSRILIAREERAVAADLALPETGGNGLLWDRRFLIRLAPKPGRVLRVGVLEAAHYAALPAPARAAAHHLPSAVRRTLPALKGLEGVLAVPHLNYCRAPEFHDFSAEFYIASPVARWPGPGRDLL